MKKGLNGNEKALFTRGHAGNYGPVSKRQQNQDSMSPHKCVLGLSLFQGGKYEDAIAQFSEALKIKPAYPEAHDEWGNALFLEGKISDAIEQYIECLAIKPDFAKANNNLGLALMRQNRDKEAIFQFNEALRIDPGSLEARENLQAAIGSTISPQR